MIESEKCGFQVIIHMQRITTFLLETNLVRLPQHPNCKRDTVQPTAHQCQNPCIQSLYQIKHLYIQHYIHTVFPHLYTFNVIFLPDIHIGLPNIKSINILRNVNQ